MDVGSANSKQWIPIELLKMAQGQRATSLDPAQQREMIRQTATRPAERRRHIERAVAEHARLQEDPTARAFRVDIKPTMMQVGSLNPKS